MPSSAGPTNSQATALSDQFTRQIRQRIWQGLQFFEALLHRRSAADVVVHDGDRLAVVLAEPRLLERVDRPALLVLLAQELEVDPPVVRLDDLRVVVHLGVRVVEPGDEAPLALHVPVAVEVAAEESGELPRVLEHLRLDVVRVRLGEHVRLAVAGIDRHPGLLGGQLGVLGLSRDRLEVVGVVRVVRVAAGPEEPVRVGRRRLGEDLGVHESVLVRLLPALHGAGGAGLLVGDDLVLRVETLAPAEWQYMTSTISPAMARVSIVGWYVAHGTASYFTWPPCFLLKKST